MSARSHLRAVRDAFRRRAALLAVVAGIALPAFGGGPLETVNQLPVVYPDGGTALALNLDQGPLGSRNNAQAIAIVQNAIAMWNGVATSTLRLMIGSPLAADYTTANYGNVFQRFTDGLNPIVFDTDGSITDAIFGVGAKAGILGFAGSAYYTSGPSAGKYVEGQAVLNGSINISDATWTVVLAHEIGHFFGLDHSQLDATQGLASNNYALMYPIAYRSLQTLHEDDVAAVSSLYPSASLAVTYGQLTGAFTTVGGTPILGANIWARESDTGKVYSVVSDFLTQGNGYFRLYLPAGRYALNAESISSNFTGGSGVGPYSNSASSASFLSPHPIPPVVLGGAATPREIVITAGCFATASFRLDGTGSVSGNCAGSSPSATTTSLTSSANPATAGSLVTLTATVVGAAPTGSVSFKDGGATVAGCGAVALGGSGNSRTAVCGSSTLAAGVHSLVATYGGDAANSASTGSALSQVVTSGGGSGSGGANVALASVGAVASASSTYSAASYPVAAVNDNERAGRNWGNGGGWSDASGGRFPDWVDIAFSGRKSIDRVVVYSVQDNRANPIEPSDSLTFSLYGIRDFVVQGWDGSLWVDLATVSGNTLVKRSVTFAAFSTDRIRIQVTNALASYSRITEIEAWGVAVAGAPPTVTSLVSSGSPAAAGAAVAFTASVTGSSPTGSVGFTRNGVPLDGCAAVALTGAGNTRAAVCSSNALAVGTHNIVARYGGNSGNLASASNVLAQVVVGGASRNVALSTAGAVASASSTFGAGFPVAAANDGQRTGANWGNGGGWKDASSAAFPDWVQINFSGTKTIDRVVVYTLQDDYLNPVEPTDNLMFSTNGVKDFSVRGWNGSTWVTLATVTANNLVKRTVTFAAFATDRIRIKVTSAAGANSAVTEVEAWGQ